MTSRKNKQSRRTLYIILLILSVVAIALTAVGHHIAKSGALSVEVPHTLRQPIPPHQERIVLIHGWGRHNGALAYMGERFERLGYEVHLIDYHSMRSLTEIMREVEAQLSQCCITDNRKTHYVGHSTGGLLIRSYLSTHRPTNLGHTVVFGTPSQGAALADKAREYWFFDIVEDSAASELGTHPNAFWRTLKKPNYPIGVIAGNYPGSVSPPEIIPGPDDGIVAVRETQFDGMTDFVEVHVNHNAMRNDDDTFWHIISFLKNGLFIK